MALQCGMSFHWTQKHHWCFADANVTAVSQRICIEHDQQLCAQVGVTMVAAAQAALVNGDNGADLAVAAGLQRMLANMQTSTDLAVLDINIIRNGIVVPALQELVDRCNAFQAPLGT